MSRSFVNVMEQGACYTSIYVTTRSARALLAALVFWLLLGVHVVASRRRGESREKVFAHFSAPP